MSMISIVMFGICTFLFIGLFMGLMAIVCCSGVYVFYLLCYGVVGCVKILRKRWRS